MGGLIAAGWLLSGSTAHAEQVQSPATAITEVNRVVDRSCEIPGARCEGRETTSDPEHSAVTEAKTLSSPIDGVVSSAAEAMAGRGVDGITSQRTPGFPESPPTNHTTDVGGALPQTGGGSGHFGPAMGDSARSGRTVPSLVVLTPVAWHIPPVVRTAADEPSFSPD
ncbi:hypothetical protein [Rhizohabitans arisaemae]|uniref:hypothetical protein n=1 Tax=Rhizohabitans arisaemae TaxID=2720610 RepID=UPI0024B0C46E|nr:hypothetical protein [Rhizohabitans arisaemae]